MLIALSMVLSFLPMTVSVSAEGEQEPVSYWAFNVQTMSYDKTKSCTEYTPIGSDTTAWSTGWYVADSSLELGKVTVTGDVNLILKDGKTLTVKGGVAVNKGNSLTIYAQSDGDNMGALTAEECKSDCAGIGGAGYGEDGGAITIHGGKIDATGGARAAGIGGGD